MRVRVHHNGRLHLITLSNGVSRRLRNLPYDLGAYFLKGPGAKRIPVKMLILSRVRIQGVASANRLMMLAYGKKHARRVPIVVRPLGRHYRVLDGNSTAINAIASDWPLIMADVAPLNRARR